jgi:hypothetical protein
MDGTPQLEQAKVGGPRRLDRAARISLIAFLAALTSLALTFVASREAPLFWETSGSEAWGALLPVVFLATPLLALVSIVSGLIAIPRNPIVLVWLALLALGCGALALAIL